jgi:hypothetical protein
VAKPVKKAPPSTWNNITSGTKNLCTKMGQTVGLTKAPPPKPDVAIPRQMVPKKDPPKSWFSSLFQPKEPPPPSKVTDFIQQKRVGVP